MNLNNEFDPIGGDGVPASPDAVPQESSPRLEAERAEFCEWIATAAPFDANVGMVEHAMKTSAAWEGWMARAAAQDFREVLPASMASPGGRHPALPLLPPEPLTLDQIGELEFGGAVSRVHWDTIISIVRATERAHGITGGIGGTEGGAQ